VPYARASGYFAGVVNEHRGIVQRKKLPGRKYLREFHCALF